MSRRSHKDAAITELSRQLSEALQWREFFESEVKRLRRENEKLFGLLEKTVHKVDRDENPFENFIPETEDEKRDRESKAQEDLARITALQETFSSVYNRPQTRVSLGERN